MPYLTYAEYTEMGGNLIETTFNDLSFEAESVINWYTFNRLKNEVTVPTEVKKLMYRLIQMINAKQIASAIPLADGSSTSGASAGITGQSNDGVSISYNVISANEVVANSKKEMEEMVKMYLQGVTNSLGRKVLYRGLYPNE